MQTDKLSAPDRMTPAAMAALVDAAFRSPKAQLFLDAVVTTFATFGRSDDATDAAWIALLFDRGEIDALMSLRTSWRLGHARSPADAACRVAAPH